MLAEHNPIAELIHQIQKKWTDEASPFPELKLVRWLIKPEWARLFEGFLRLESTEHGAIPEVLITLLTPFQNEYLYSRSLMKDWMQAFNDDHKTGAQFTKKNPGNDWNADRFLAELSGSDPDYQLLQIFSLFHTKMVNQQMRLVVALYPRSIESTEGFKRWLTKMLNTGIPEPITFMIFDHVGEFYFDKVFEKNPETTKSLYVNLDLDGAVKKIAKMGNPNSPEVKFRECILEMGESVQKNNLKQLQEWGEKGLQITQRSGLKGLFASAHIVYAGMLFNFKQYEKIDALLIKGLQIAKQGVKLNDVSCKPLLIQFYGYIAASKQLQKKNTEAIEAFEKQGDLAIEYQLPAMALMPYQQAYTLSRKSLPHRYEEILKKAFAAGKALSLEEQTNSSFASIASDFMQWQEGKQLWEEAKQTDNDLKIILGENWKEKAKKPTPYTITKPQEPAPIN